MPPPPPVWHTRKYSVEYFLRACPDLQYLVLHYDAISMEKVVGIDELFGIFYGANPPRRRPAI